MRSFRKVVFAAAATVLMFAVDARAQAVEEFDVASEQLLDIDLETGGSVEIKGWERSTVRVEAEPYGKGSEPKVEIRRTDEGVEVKIEEDVVDHSDWRRGRKGHQVKVQVPVRFNLKIETMGGGITIADVHGRMEGRTMGGKIELSNLKGWLDLTTMGGNITLVDSEVDGKVSTMGGRVSLENVTGDVDGSSMGGNVTYKNVQRSDGSSTGEAVHITTMGGAIELASAPHGASLETMGGNVVVDRAAEFVEAETMGGNIILREVNGRVEATTMGGDVEVRIVGDPQAEGRDIELSSMSGEVRLTVPRNFSMDVEIELDYTKSRGGRYSIKSDLNLAIEEDSSWDYGHGSARRTIRGTGSFAGGKNKVRIKTVNGSVYLNQQ